MGYFSSNAIVNKKKSSIFKKKKKGRTTGNGQWKKPKSAYLKWSEMKWEIITELDLKKRGL